MHLNQGQVAALLPLLQVFAETGSLPRAMLVPEPLIEPLLEEVVPEPAEPLLEEVVPEPAEPILEFVPTKCPDCRTQVGQPHDPGCDVERCSVCKGQWIACGCKEHDPLLSKWTGIWPGVAECRERGWYSVMTQGRWRSCSKTFPGAVEDLNRWTRFQMRGRDDLEGEPLLDDL